MPNFMKDLFQSSEKEFLLRLQRLMLFRVIIACLFMGAFISLRIKESKSFFEPVQLYQYGLISAIFVLTFIYALSLKYSKRLYLIAYIQLIIDTVLITILIFITGGIESIFTCLYPINIIGATLVLYRKGGMVIASLSGILYGLLMDLHYYGILHPLETSLKYPIDYQSSNTFFYMITVNICAFFLIGLLTAYPVEQSRKRSKELKDKEEDLIRLDALNKIIINNVSFGIISIDKKDRILLFNPEAERIFKVKAKDIVGKNLSIAIPSLWEILSKKLSDESRSDIRYRDIIFNGKGGIKRYLRFYSSQLNLPHPYEMGKVLFIQDITGQKRIEEDLKKVRELAIIGELAAGIAHEIRNPLASISGSIQMLNRHIRDSDIQKRLMSIILREIKRLNSMIEDFLIFSRPKRLRIKKFYLNELIEEAVSLFKSSDRWNQDIKIRKEMDQDILMESDPDQIKQIFWNLFLNASDAMPDGGSLTISIRRLNSGPLPMVQIEIKDTGKGFSDKALSNLFVPFFTTKKGGSGLGLAIVKRIVTNLKGTIEGGNRPGGGAYVRVCLPISIKEL